MLSKHQFDNPTRNTGSANGMSLSLEYLFDWPIAVFRKPVIIIMKKNHYVWFCDTSGKNDI